MESDDKGNKGMSYEYLIGSYGLLMNMKYSHFINTSYWKRKELACHSLSAKEEMLSIERELLLSYKEINK